MKALEFTSIFSFLLAGAAGENSLGTAAMLLAFSIVTGALAYGISEIKGETR